MGGGLLLLGNNIDTRPRSGLLTVVLICNNRPLPPMNTSIIRPPCGLVSLTILVLISPRSGLISAGIGSNIRP